MDELTRLDEVIREAEAYEEIRGNCCNVILMRMFHKGLTRGNQMVSLRKDGRG